MDEVQPVDHVEQSDKPTTLVLDKGDYAFVINSEGIVTRCILPTTVADEEEVPEIVTKFVEVMEEVGQMDEPEKGEPIHDLDLTKQTVSLGDESGPVVSLMKGHVDAMTYVKAFREEGWDANHPEPTEEEWKEMAESEKGELVHTYGKFNPEGNGSWRWNLTKDDEGAEPVTVRYW